jgi:hypothetical protein
VLTWSAPMIPAPTTPTRTAISTSTLTTPR